MIGIQVDYTRIAAVVEPIVIEEGVLVAEVNYSRVAAIVELQDAQGWKLIGDTPRYRAEVNKVEIVAAEAYALVVDKINLSDDIATSEQVIFEFTKVIADEGIAIDSVSFEMNKPLSDNAGSSETIVFNLEKPFSDDVTGTDSIIFNMNKVLLDDVPATELVLFELYTGGTGVLGGAAINETAINLPIRKVF